MKTVVAVVRGGPAGEHRVSLATGKAVLDALDREKYEPLDILVAADGMWHRDGVCLPPDEALRGVDLVFNALHGVFGGDGTVQRIYEALGVRHTGSGVTASERAFDKEFSKQVALRHGIKVPRHAVVARGVDVEKEARRIMRELSLPLIVKPATGSSSLGAAFADSFAALVAGIRAAHRGAPRVLVEEFIRGKEATVGVVEGLDDEVRALAPFEITLPPGRLFYDFEAKYAEGIAREESPGSLTANERRALEDAARTMHRALFLAHYSRSDFRVDERGVHYLETNAESVLDVADILPRSLSIAGHSFPHFVDHVLADARRRDARPPKPRYAKYYTRTLSAIECELWQRGERVEWPAMNEQGYFFHPLFSFVPGKGTSVYYNLADPRQDPRMMAYYFSDNRQEFLDILETSRRFFAHLDALNSKSPFSAIFHCLAKAWPGVALANTFASECRELVDDATRDAAFRFFAEVERKVYAAEGRLRGWLRDNLPGSIRPYASLVTFDEVMTMRFPDRWELEARRKGFVLFGGRLMAAPLEDIARQRGLIIKEDAPEFTGSLRGTSMRRGRARGPARVIFESSQANRVREGDVLITSMTTPDLGSALRRAAAFVTDEGSLTSEAAIVGRDNEKPFVVGTGYATAFIKDGDMVEVDADEGIVRLVAA